MPEAQRARRIDVGSIALAIAILLIALACGADEKPARQEVSMRLTSPAFEHEGDIPVRYTCDGDDVSPALNIDDTPTDTVSMALLMDDPDAPAGTWDHWVVYDISPTAEIPEGVGSLGTAGNNSWGRSGYGGPCPPSGTHRYVFTLYALDARLDLSTGADKAAVLDALADHVLAEAVLMGRYRRP